MTQEEIKEDRKKEKRREKRGLKAGVRQALTGADATHGHSALTRAGPIHSCIALAGADPTRSHAEVGDWGAQQTMEPVWRPALNCGECSEFGPPVGGG